MDGHAIYMQKHARNNDFPIDFAIFTKALRTNRWMDIPSYRYAIVASKNHLMEKGFVNPNLLVTTRIRASFLVFRKKTFKCYDEITYEHYPAKNVVRSLSSSEI